MSTMRSHVIEKFSKFFTNDAMVNNLEKSVFNWAVKNCTHPSWENPSFRHAYRSKFTGIIVALSAQENDLIDKITSGEIMTRNVASMEPDELWPTGPYALAKQRKKAKEAIKDNNSGKLPANYVGMFKCGKCKSMKTTYYQMQTRSADEPMTTFVTCMDCNNRFKFS